MTKSKRIISVVLILLIMAAVGIGIPFLLLHAQSQSYLKDARTATVEKYQLNESENSEEYMHKLIRLFNEENLKIVSELPADNYSEAMAIDRFYNAISNMLEFAYIDSEDIFKKINIESYYTNLKAEDGVYLVSYIDIFNIEIDKLVNEILYTGEISAYTNRKDASLGYWRLNATIGPEYFNYGWQDEINFDIVIDGLTGNCIYIEMNMANGFFLEGSSEISDLISTTLIPMAAEFKIINSESKLETNGAYSLVLGYKDYKINAGIIEHNVKIQMTVE